ncbi:MAG TPA: bifunctional 5,10-methylenetetrahydrofolate dehydrogenase/5,10-methenyltetrahydrofolate cyclohydrolase [Patescibacteria group bacterium]|nr:bifunctional 5,10-methylenetetrahydrofolate dehydrogenase/5,10-methenyltetrahydrofolate cyclohydrolase [Patescibacteria group bacterium]
MHIINGKKIASDILHDIRRTIVERNLIPGLAIILVGSDPGSEVYVKRKLHTAHKVGITPHLYRFTNTGSQNEILECIDFLNNDSDIHGIIVQLPLPKHLNPDTLIQRIRPDKDADGFHSENLKHLGDEAFPQPVTVMSVMECLQNALNTSPQPSPYKGEVGASPLERGRGVLSSVAIICKSDILFTPLATLLSHQNIKADHFIELNKKCVQYDIVIIALGKPNILTKEYTKKDAIVIDVGISRIENNGTTSIKGDADIESLKDHAEAITPVPGGVGPVTVALLLKNTLTNCINITKL